MSSYDTARALGQRGFKVFPIAAGAKMPPLWKGWPERATTTPDSATWPDPANVGIHCDGFIVIDVDVKKGGDQSLEFLEITYGLPHTTTTRTPTGGRHIFYLLPPGHPGVPNSVEVLGKGLDVRSSGGYVVAPGSEVAAGRYRFEGSHEGSPNQAPAWLVERLGQAAPKAEAPIATVVDAPEDVVERARAWLQTAERSVKGQGGDQAAYRVACGLRDRGVSYLQACELMRSEAWDHGCGWRDHKLEDKPIRSAYRYAQNSEPGSLSVTAADFPIVEASTAPPATPRARTRVQTLTELAASKAKEAGYLVKGLLNRRSQAVGYGEPGGGKTFVFLDLAYHVAAALAWMGRRVRGGPVLYLAYEGVGGLARRAQALQQRYGKAEVPLYVQAADYNLRDVADRRRLGEALAELPAKPVLIVIDTLARAMKGGDENSAQDMGALMDAVAMLSQSTGACVLLVHHSGKNKNGGARGSSALLGAIDTEIEIDEWRITPTKQRDIELCEGIGFKLVPLVVGMDEDGDELTSCVVESAKVATAAPLKVSGDNKRAFDALCEKRPDNTPITELEWLQSCEAFGLTKKRMWDVKRTLQRALLIDINQDGTIQRKMA